MAINQICISIYLATMRTCEMQSVLTKHSIAPYVCHVVLICYLCMCELCRCHVTPNMCTELHVLTFKCNTLLMCIA